MSGSVPPSPWVSGGCPAPAHWVTSQRLLRLPDCHARGPQGCELLGGRVPLPRSPHLCIGNGSPAPSDSSCGKHHVIANPSARRDPAFEAPGRGPPRWHPASQPGGAWEPAWRSQLRGLGGLSSGGGAGRGHLKKQPAPWRWPLRLRRHWDTPVPPSGRKPPFQRASLTGLASCGLALPLPAPSLLLPRVVNSRRREAVCVAVTPWPAGLRGGRLLSS